MKLIDADKLLEWIHNSTAEPLPTGLYFKGMERAFREMKQIIESGEFDVEGRESIPKEDTKDGS